MTFKELFSKPKNEWVANGLSPWKLEDGSTIYLLRREWYDKIPNGTKLYCINGEEEIFEKGKTDDDARYGYLAFGLK